MAGASFDPHRLRAEAVADTRRGLRSSAGDLAVGALVVAPFTLTLGVLIGWMTWAPSGLLVSLMLIVTAAATVWNAGWRARPE
jgi:hypothetical protein